mmetsp:Transcript_93017/g.150172  ORF Transcript_93017/g.150172 Transcript_93017/m.150172 type:complete len:85 (-) Transcript_93017:1629-1883(-)
MSHGESVGSSRGKSGGEIVGDVVSQDEAVAWMLELGWSRAAAVEGFIASQGSVAELSRFILGRTQTRTHTRALSLGLSLALSCY